MIHEPPIFFLHEMWKTYALELNEYGDLETQDQSIFFFLLRNVLHRLNKKKIISSLKSIFFSPTFCYLHCCISHKGRSIAYAYLWSQNLAPGLAQEK